MYRPSEVAYTVILARPIDTVTTLEIRGSDDNFASNRREFSTEEEIRVNGSVTAADGANLSATQVEVYLDGALRGTAPLTYNPATRTNLYTYSLGTITVEGSHEIRVYFPRYRVFAASEVLARIEIPGVPVDLLTLALAGFPVLFTLSLIVYAELKKARILP